MLKRCRLIQQTCAPLVVGTFNLPLSIIFDLLSQSQLVSQDVDGITQSGLQEHPTDLCTTTIVPPELLIQQTRNLCISIPHQEQSFAEMLCFPVQT